MSVERFTSCCATLGISSAGVARMAFLQITRERPGALLGLSSLWHALFFCFVRGVAPDPLVVCAHTMPT